MKTSTLLLLSLLFTPHSAAAAPAAKPGATAKYRPIARPQATDVVPLAHALLDTERCPGVVAAYRLGDRCVSQAYVEKHMARGKVTDLGSCRPRKPKADDLKCDIYFTELLEEKVRPGKASWRTVTWLVSADKCASGDGCLAGATAQARLTTTVEIDGDGDFSGTTALSTPTGLRMLKPKPGHVKLGKVGSGKFRGTPNSVVVELYSATGKHVGGRALAYKESPAVMRSSAPTTVTQDQCKNAVNELVDYGSNFAGVQAGGMVTKGLLNITGRLATAGLSGGPPGWLGSATITGIGVPASGAAGFGTFVLVKSGVKTLAGRLKLDSFCDRFADPPEPEPEPGPGPGPVPGPGDEPDDELPTSDNSCMACTSVGKELVGSSAVMNDDDSMTVTGHTEVVCTDWSLVQGSDENHDLFCD